MRNVDVQQPEQQCHCLFLELASILTRQHVVLGVKRLHQLEQVLGVLPLPALPLPLRLLLLLLLLLKVLRHIPPATLPPTIWTSLQ
jgi:hypothetical protein